MEAYYEESAVARDAKSEAKKYKLVGIFSYVSLSIGIILALMGFAAFRSWKDFFAWLLFPCACFYVGWFFLYKFKKRFNVTYDYLFVSGELRIAKVFNAYRRKPLIRIQAEEILQLGDAESDSFQEIMSAPEIKAVYCTSNIEPMEGKFFMYLLINDNGKKAYVLECREEMLLNIMKFVNRTTLARDYVAQAKKNRA